MRKWRIQRQKKNERPSYVMLLSLFLVLAAPDGVLGSVLAHALVRTPTPGLNIGWGHFGNT